MKRKFAILSAVLLPLGFTACSGSSNNATPQAGLGGAGSAAPQYNFVVKDQAGNMLYTSAGASASLSAVAGQQVILDAVPADGQSGYTLSGQISRSDLVVPPAPITISLVPGQPFDFTFPAAGDYVIKLTATMGSTSYPARFFQGSVSCNNPTPFTAATMNAAAISVAAGSADNLYTYDASGVVGSGGQAPYFYAWDFTGDGSQDSLFSTSPTATDVYESFVGERTHIALLVKDSCNTLVTLSVDRTVPVAGLASLTPGGLYPFIHGVVNSASGSAAGYRDILDPTPTGINYYATNVNLANAPASYKPVQTNFSFTGDGLATSSFTVGSNMFTYGLPSSVQFGEQLSVGGIKVTEDMTSPTIDVSGAKMSAISFSTEQVGDGLPQIIVTDSTGASCTLTNPGATIVPHQGTPCTGGTANKWGYNMTWTVHVWGTYSCTNLTGPGSSVVSMHGEFDATPAIVDACIGGGGQGGGGINPIQF